jgi:hypothetical protein
MEFLTRSARSLEHILFRCYVPYLRVHKPHFFDKNLPSKIGERLIHGILKK